ncbi:nitroreductase family protein [Zafaria sp. J156]|jgi:nitroreductase|uniref:nitroreductase family protein n=1 Tax=Micrococcaceae TaxID=1268 RepID=UPI002E7649FC|nr:nitroreductase family protein [Zafaria sp. J156]MEE1622753.1 nitroreductase family protein [Zafaria sp. J156]
MNTKHQDELLQARYGTQPKPKNLIWNAQVEHLLDHRSVRTFLPEPLPEGAVETMIAAAQSASASSNLHQWSVVVITDPDRREELMHLAGSKSMNAVSPFISEAPAVLLWVADLSRNARINEQHGNGLAVYGHLDSFLMASVDTALAAQNAAVAAESIGLGVTYLGSLRNHAKEVAALIGIPAYSYVVFGMAVGKPDPERRSGIRPRPAQSVVLHHNHYDSGETAEWVHGYEDAFREFRTTQGMKPKTWIDSVVYGSSMDYMDGRENLRTTVQERGFELR